MNNEFIIKMLKAEMLRYEAFKEILPECVKSKVDDVENSFKDIVKQLAVDIIRESTAAPEAEVKKDSKKINVDFDN